VAIFDINAKLGEALAARLSGQGYRVSFYNVDVSDAERCKTAAAAFAAKNGDKIHALVNNGTHCPFCFHPPCYVPTHARVDPKKLGVPAVGNSCLFWL
jgi:NAD(P)-dependent dehydrogenase (short-subunit alcohol dehydrogenase family)